MAHEGAVVAEIRRRVAKMEILIRENVYFCATEDMKRQKAMLEELLSRTPSASGEEE